MKNIWIDLENSPHVLFFEPIIKALKKQGFLVYVTARDYAQVSELVNLFKIESTIVGKHYGKNKFNKIIGLFIRSFQLFLTIYNKHIDLAFSHFSRSQLLAAKTFKIPTVVAYDYEYVQKLLFLKPDLFIVPEVLYKNSNLSMNKRYTYYPGLKENVYMQSFKFDNSLKKIFNINEKDILITVRPPATEAHYHNNKSSQLFELIIDYLLSDDNTKVLILPRTNEQADTIVSRWNKYIINNKIVIPHNAVNGIDLVNISDLVISGGGTMVREASVIDVPAYSFFCGKTGEVDKYLEKKGKLSIIRTPNDIKSKIKFVKKKKEKRKESIMNLTISSIINIINKLVNR